MIQLHRVLLLFAIWMSCMLVRAQYSVSGSMPLLPHHTIYLMGYSGAITYTIDSVLTDSVGEFTLHYQPKDNGLGYISEQGGKPLFVLLENENIQLIAYQPDNMATVEVKQGKQTQLLYDYAKSFQLRSNALQALIYLQGQYQSNVIHPNQKKSLQFITQEIETLKNEDEYWLQRLDKKSFLAWYLPMRKLATLAVTLPLSDDKPVPATIDKFRQLDYSDPRWYKSDLYTDIVEKHFLLIENSGGDMDSIYRKMKTSIDAILASLQQDNKKINELSLFMFQLFEKRSLYPVSEYLSLKLLEQKQCSLDDKLVSNLEGYRTMRIGNVAPDISIGNRVYAPNYKVGTIPQSLYTIPAKYKIVIFAASWCEHCMGELPQLIAVYNKYKSKADIEALMVSLDGIDEGFRLLSKNCPFISTCDLQQWECKAAKDYYVTGTPTIYLLNDKNEIIVKPVSPAHLDVCIDNFIINQIPIPNFKK